MKVLSLMVLALSLCLAPSLASAKDGRGDYGFYWNDKSPTFLCGGHKCKAMKFSYVKSRDQKKGFKGGYDTDQDRDYGKDHGKDKDYGKDKDNGDMDGGNGEPTVIPEINAGGTSMAFVLISGLLMVMRERRRRGMKV